MTIGYYIRTILCYLLPAFFLWFPKSMIVEQNLGKKPFERLEHRSLIRMEGHRKFICDYKVCYQVIHIIRNICRMFLLGWMLNALVLSRIYEDTYLFRRIMEVGQGVAGFIAIDVSFISDYIIDSKTHRKMKRKADEMKYQKDYARAKAAFEKTNRPNKKKRLLCQMEFIEQQFMKLGKIKSKYEIRWYTQCLWCCINLPKKRFEEAKRLKNTDEFQCWDKMTDEAFLVGDELCDSVVTATTVGYVSLPQRENMYAAYDLYVQMIEEVQDMFPQKEYRKDCKKLEHNRKLYEDLLEYREEHRWNQNKDVKE